MRYTLKEVVAETTQRCNMNCMHCGSGCKSLKVKNELDVDEWKGCLDQFKAMGVEKIVYSGGEPATKVGIEEICAYTSDIGLRYGIITNGLHFEGPILEAIKDKRPFAIGISLDGLKETHNKIRRNEKSWDQIIKLISNLQKNGIQVCIVTSVNRLNYNDLPQLAGFLNLIEVNSWQIQLVMPAGRAGEQRDFIINEEIFKELCLMIIKFRRAYPKLNIQAADCFGLAPSDSIREGGWGGCAAGIHSLGIDSVGNIMPCLSIRSDLRCGNIRDEAIEDIWNFSSGFDFNRKFNPKNVRGKCKSCEYLNYCRGGCASASFAQYKRFHSTPFCYTRSFQ